MFVSVFVLFLGLGCDVSETAKSVTSGVVGTTVEATKGVADGINKGIEDGRKGAQSTDGSMVLSTPEEIWAVTNISVIEAKASGDSAEIVLAVENSGATPSHLIGLNAAGGALLIDNDGFSTQLNALSLGQLGKAIDVPPNAKVKVSLYFDGDAAKASTLRVWGKDIPIPSNNAAATGSAQ